jgi:hypothetical protein
MQEKIHNFTILEVFKASTELARSICDRVRGLEECNIRFSPNKESKDAAIMELSFKKAPFYFMYPLFGYYQNPNQIAYGYHWRDYRTTIGGLLKPFKSTSFGYKKNYAKNQS